MKPFHHPSKSFRPVGHVRLLGTVLAFAAVTPAYAADVNLTLNNAIGTSSFNTNYGWSNAAIPSAGNAYFVPANFGLRTPPGSGLNHTFAGDSLTFTGNPLATAPGLANFIYKGITNNNIITVNNLTLNFGLINNASDSSTQFTLAGNIIVAGTATSVIFSNNGTITVTAPISGSTGALELRTNNGTLGRQVILTAANTYTGDVFATGASGVVLSTTGKLAFAFNPGTSVYNKIYGTAPIAFNGVFTIDLTGAGTTIGDSYLLVDNSTLGETYGAGFAVEGWTKYRNFFISPDGNYHFTPATGLLSRVDLDSDKDGLPDSYEIDYFDFIEVASGDDQSDSDFSSNYDEFMAGTDPIDETSFPDIDADSLPDGWETNYFLNLAQTFDGDPDGDYSTNGEELAAGSIPTSYSSFPDADQDQFGPAPDGMSDGWEVFFFGSIQAGNPEADADGDLYNNVEEFVANTDPLIQFSSPDSDIIPDGLPDGWEIFYFRVGDQPREEAIENTNGATDSDFDGRLNLTEYHNGTNPLVVDTAPLPLAYWRFDEKTTGAVPVGAGALTDYSGNGNAMVTFADYTAPAHVTRVPDTTVANTGAMDRASLAFVATNDNRFTTDNIYSNAAPINTFAFQAMTLELSFRTTLANISQGIIGKAGNPSGAAPPYQTPFTLKLNPLGNIVAGMIDSANLPREVVSTSTVLTGEWYSVAVTVSPTVLSLWVKGPGDSDYVRESTAPIAGAWSAAAGNSPWVIGQIVYNPSDDGFGPETGHYSFTGDIDEVRISGSVLRSGQFLANVASPAGNLDTDNDGLDDLWERANFNDSLGEIASGDFDKDGTSNIAEYLLGLNPKSGTSIFSGSLSGATFSWISAAGQKFMIQRSTTLLSGQWEDMMVAPVTATGPLSTWTDPAPPVGKAFYRAVLSTN